MTQTVHSDASCCILGGGGGGVTCICHDTRMCHYFGYFFGGCSQIFGYLFGLFPDFGVSFFGYSRIFGYHFLVKFDFFKNNPDFGVLILIFSSMTLWNVACRALVSMILQFSFLFYHACAKIVFNCYQFEFLHMWCFLILTSFYHCG